MLHSSACTYFPEYRSLSQTITKTKCIEKSNHFRPNNLHQSNLLLYKKSHYLPPTHFLLCAHLDDVNRAVLVVGPHPLFHQESLVVHAPDPAQEHFDGDVRRLPVDFGDGPAAQGIEHFAERFVANFTDLN